ncbi:MAG: bifunctional nicotinamidase/pyrazinamidase [Gammaproteobacteria bacterium]|nr:MAG: bifunctional nicotinamidase/pyrazinamidase [Gammaproteobacteria bacterium]
MSERRPDPSRTALILVDIQPDFMPGGALPVAGGDEILEPVRALMGSSLHAVAVATQDWHPRGHVSFASSHPGHRPFDVIELHGHDQTLWPDHCVQGTPGAELHPALPWERVAAIVRKGMDPQVDSYSGFRNNWGPDGRRPPTGLAGYLRERGVEEVILCGLARDVCVRWTAEDAAAEGFQAWFVWDATRAVDPAGDEATRAALESRGVRVVTVKELLG